MHQEDRQLVRQLIAGDKVAFRGFFEDYFPRLFRFILRRVNGDEEAARDVVQAALTSGSCKLQLYRGEASLFTWFCQIARNELAGYIARTARQLPPSCGVVALENDPTVRAGLESIPADSEAQPEFVQQREEVAVLVHLVLDYLPQRYARILELKYLEGLSVEAIAAHLGVSAIAVQSLLARSRAAFRDVYGTLNFHDFGLTRSTPIDRGVQ
ncbi:MAG TPA: RNA polymerase sigma factor [Steroidobacteraceae bacterium]|jgi:RNA polymerase sigma-70 factor (ECF subfamily)